MNPLQNPKPTYLDNPDNSDTPQEPPSSSESEYNFKLILLGDIAVGKTSIMNRFVENEFKLSYTCTVGVEFRVKKVRVSSDSIANLKIWDTCGEEKYRTITRQYYHHTDGAILVFDLTNKNSFMKLNGWIRDIKDNGPEDVTIILVGNKADVKGRNPQLSEQGKEFANKNQIPYIEVSAKMGTNIDLIFENITKKIILKMENMKDIENEEKGYTEMKGDGGVALSKVYSNKKGNYVKNRDGGCCT